jgi:hypothetical protein
MSNPLPFLEAIAGYAREENRQGSADKAIRIGVIDPAYDHTTFPATLPKVIFDGEATASGKRYPVITPGYLPRASDKVVLIPCGNTYVIVGSLDGDAAGWSGGGLALSGPTMWEAFSSTNETTTSTIYTAGTQVGTPFVAPLSGAVTVHLQAGIGHNSTTISQSAHMSFEIRVGATVGAGAVFLAAHDDRSARVLNPSIDAGFKYGTGVRDVPVTGLTPGSSYNARLMFRTTVATGTYLQRHILVRASAGPLG